ncbi:DUF427 domain-containing protein [Actinomadura violacea]|uniref:DUF427 domain-containing protein n=1 Tax=Actinomadura violacea TaxID=2819934 RepID=A0ABS3S8K9_9ACTN|nr:DUF427 domain-containing protein [Actinomadura violacea]MBO2464903.1 DUF427 domain-containing protein [Actinomadura violacea]
MPELFDEPLEDRVIEREAARQVDYTVKAEPTPKRVRAYCGGVAVADSCRARLLLESRHMPVYYFPAEDVRTDLLTPSGKTRDDPVKGKARFFGLRVGEREIRDAAWTFEDAPPGAPGIAGHIAFYWKTMDAWFEEDDEIYGHPRDPYHRVDVLNSSRHIEVVVLGEVVADTRRPRLLVETNIPPRWYIPKQDVRMDMLQPSPTSSQCPYKGRPVYWSVRAGDRLMHDVAWAYPYPIPECPKIENLVCFFDEQVDAVYVDGEKAPRPKTAWSRAPRITTIG